MDKFLIRKNVVKIQPKYTEASSIRVARFAKPDEPKQKAVK